jgi:tetratricopeptide (TPR) repeat protein
LGLFVPLPNFALAHPGLHHDIERVTQAIELDPANADLLIQRSHYYRLDGQPELALLDLDKAQILQPSRRDIAAHKGLALATMGRDEEAIHELSRFLDSGPGSAVAFADRARLRSDRDRASYLRLSFRSRWARMELYIQCDRLQTEMGWLSNSHFTGRVARVG